MASISVTWHTMGDDRVCPICKSIEGHTWTFIVGQGELNGRLEHPTHGTVWDVDRGSQAHGHKGNCRCFLTQELDIGDIIAKVNAVREAVRGMLSEVK